MTTKYWRHIVFAVLAIFYTVGIIGLSSPEFSSIFLVLTPLNLLLTTGVLIGLNRDFSGSFWTVLVIIFLVGFGAEVAGVHSGLLFGEYSYGSALGIKLFDVPLIIGLNWFLLAIIARGSTQFVSNKMWAQVFLSALLMTGLDFLIEPVAVKLDFWSWENSVIPIQNYVMWFIVSLGVQGCLGILQQKIDKQVSIVIFGIQVLFFTVLNSIL